MCIRKRIVLSLCLGVCAIVGRLHAGGLSENVQLFSQIPLGNFASNPNNGNDCWGYVSGSGREYALMGISNALAVVEITNPGTPVIVGEIGHPNCFWSDVKVFGDYCYVVMECGGGMDVINLSNVDSGFVTLVQTYTAGGFDRSHNVAIDTGSGYLYLCDSNLNGGRLVALDLSNPASPVLAGQIDGVQGANVHDAQIVTYTSGPNNGKQIAFCAVGGLGLDIYDVTDKGNMFRLSRTSYPNNSFAHQCWLSEDRQYLYLNDEADNVNETVIFDVTNLASPVLVNTYTAGLTSIDHNQYFHNDFIYEADYTAGLRIFCASSPANPVQVGWYDTYSPNDNASFNGAWSTYPFFPSGTVIVSDINSGLFVLDASQAHNAGSLAISYPNGQPDLISPQGGTSMLVEIAGACGGTANAATGLLHYNAGAGFVTTPLSVAGPDTFAAVFPATTCPNDVAYYVSMETTDGVLVTDPFDAPASTYTTTSGTGFVATLSDDFEADLGWTVSGTAATGQWERGVPVNDPGWPHDPVSDADGSGQCYLTQNALGDTDVDAGFTFLFSPVLDLSAGDLTITYEYFLRLDNANGNDFLRLGVNNNGGVGSYTTLATHNTDGGLTWRHQEITTGDIQNTGVALTTTMILRFGVVDGSPESVVEAGLDAFKILEVDCSAVLGDLNGDGFVTITDLFIMFGEWGPCDLPCPPSCAADLDADCFVGITDLFILFGNWS